MESSVSIYCRKSDVDTVKQSASNATKAFKDLSGRDVEFQVEGSIADEACVYLLQSQCQRNSPIAVEAKEELNLSAGLAASR